ncbi:MAG: sigma-70 family RNA polymerase sigma factor [Subdoligranulum sp.]|nr:sigma-70 family RNA polymerase sigma factor [Subdoligranulum sp.]
MALDIEEQYEKIYRYCFYRLQNREQAEDITQETFLRWFASDTYRDTGQVLQYLYTIARNLCIDAYRRPYPTPLSETLSETSFEAPSSHEADPLPAIDLRTALAGLDEQDRELVLLRFVNEVPVRVLCGLTGQSRFSLRRRLNRILKTLQEALES